MKSAAVGLVLLVAGVAQAEERVTIPAGCVELGDLVRHVRDRHRSAFRRVCLPEFKIDRTEVTVAAYETCVDAGVCEQPEKDSICIGSNLRGDRPVVCVSWEQTVRYCAFAGGRLPTEDEWERAAAGPDPQTNLYPWGPEPPSCERTSSRMCHHEAWPTKACTASGGLSPDGLCDMVGNVGEWIDDAPEPRHKQRLSNGRKTRRVCNGRWDCASHTRVWKGSSDGPIAKRSFSVLQWMPDIGFRCVSD